MEDETEMSADELTQKIFFNLSTIDDLQNKIRIKSEQSMKIAMQITLGTENPDLDRSSLTRNYHECFDNTSKMKSEIIQLLNTTLKYSEQLFQKSPPIYSYSKERLKELEPKAHISFKSEEFIKCPEILRNLDTSE